MAACEACLVAHKVADAATGAVGELAGAPCYEAGAGATGAGGAAAIVLFTDIFGFAFVNSRVVADAIAAASGLPVFVPDLLGADAVAPDGFDRATFPAWRERHGDAQTRPLAEAAIAALRARGFARVGAIGYCWGGRYAALAAAAGAADAYAVAHPSFTTAADYAALRQPALLLLAEVDAAFPAEVSAEVEAALRAAGVALEARRWAGTTHGFAVRPPPDNAAALAARDEAAAAAGAFFKRHLA
jgi:dienelactone hydrolase